MEIQSRTDTLNSKNIEMTNSMRFKAKYRTKLLLRNKLLTGLFTGEKNSLEINETDITPKDYFYFRDYPFINRLDPILMHIKNQCRSCWI